VLGTKTHVMSEKKSLKLQLPHFPSHHVYDSDYDWCEKFEAPRSNNNNTNFSRPLQRRKNSKAARPAGVGANATFTVPDTPPTPDSNTKLYPALRLHRQMSTSTPDFSKIDTSDSKKPVNRVEIDAQFRKNGTDQNKNGLANQIIQSNGLSQNRNLSDTVLEKGLTAAVDKKNMDNKEKGSTPSINSKMYSTESHDHDYRSSMNEKRPSLTGGFLTNLIFGNNLFDNKPLKVSGFDMTMCAPGST